VLDHEEGSFAGCGFDVGALPNVQRWVRCRTDGRWRMPRGRAAPPVDHRHGSLASLSMSARSETILDDLAKAAGEARLTAEFQLDASPILQLP
jgi:hypothetical protein